MAYKLCLHVGSTQLSCFDRACSDTTDIPVFEVLYSIFFLIHMLFYHYYKHAREYIQVVNTSNKAIFLQSQFSEKKQLQGHITHV